MKKNSLFNYIVIAVVLIIPFMYSFFYLKAYWNPYGEGNIDNIPVAIVNEDKGDKGKSLINSLIDAKKLKISVVSSNKAEDGLYNQDYYAIIKIPKDFTSSMESASSNNKKHAVITYSPNQKSNYLASQIINNVVNTVEKNLDNQVNSKIVASLSDKIENVPSSLETISSGFNKLQNGTQELNNGATKLNNGSSTLVNGINTLKNGTDSLKTNYDKFNEGVENLKNGTNTLATSTSEFSNLSSNLEALTNGVSELKTGSDTFTAGLNSYISKINTTLDFTLQASSYIISMYTTNPTSVDINLYRQAIAYTTDLVTLYEIDPINHNGIDESVYQTAKQVKQITGNNVNQIDYLKLNSNNLLSGNSNLNTGINTLNTKVSNLGNVSSKLTDLQNGINSLNNGANTLYNSSLQIQNGINKLQSGTNELSNGSSTLVNGISTLNNGTNTLNNSVRNAKDELDSNIETTKNEVKKVETLSKYSEGPVKIKTKVVNEVSSYGTAFSPFFISIALWVGSLMMYIIFYYDKNQRFEILGIDNKNFLKRTLCYHGLATLSAIILGILLQTLLDFEITNIFLYYISLILTANTFVAIMEFLIINFNDIGKFLALIILVLQLAAAGGTFPIETVTKGFRWLNNFLPMKYTINLFRESLVSIESNLLTKNVLIVTLIFIFFFVFNILNDIRKQK